MLLLVIPLLVFGDVDYQQGYLLNSQSIGNLASHGAGYWFDGEDDYVDLGQDKPTDLTGDITISVWIYFTGAQASNRIISNGNSSEAFHLALSSSNYRVFLKSDGSTIVYSDDNSIIYDTWSHLIVTRTSAGITNFYVNGVLSGSANQDSGTPTAGTSNTIIGKSSSNSNYFNGSISDVRIYNRVLSITGIKDLYSNGNIPYAGIGADNTEFFTTAIDRTFTGGGTHWANVDIGTTFDETTDLSLVASATGQYCKITFTDIGTALAIGKQYRLTYDYSETTAGFEFKLDGASIQTLGDAVAGTSQTIEFTAEEDYTGAEWLGIYAKTSATAAGNFDNFSLIQIGCVANYNSSGVGHNQWIDNSGNENNGTVNGAIPTNLPIDDTQVLVLKNITGETTKTNWLPKGYAIKNVISVTDANITNIDLGFSDNGGEIVADVNLTAGDTKSLTVLQEVDTLTADDTFYISADNWNSGSVDLYITIERIVVK